MSETQNMSMAIVPFQEHIPSSCSPPKLNIERPPKAKEHVSRDKSLCLRDVTNAVNADTMKPESSKLKRCKKTTMESLYDTSEAQSSVMERAKKLEATLAPEFPRVAKVMRPSNVTGSFCLNLSKNFCSEYLPKQDTMIALEDESGKEYQTKYLVGKAGLSAGWRGFSIAHKIMVGDVVIFHLVNPFKFKVYIVRTNGLDVADSALGLVNLDVGRQMYTGAEVSISREPISKKNTTAYISSGNETEEFGPEVLDGIRLAESVIPFNEVKSMENFDVIINGLVLNSEFSKYHLTKYYELCCSQNSFLHETILEFLNFKLVAGIISETINISDAIRASKITTSDHDFSTWDKTLQACEMLGIKVGFLRTRLHKLASLALESKQFSNLEGDRAEARLKLSGEKETTSCHDSEIERLEAMFQEVARAAW
ncbi:B3 domain-containing protein Os01g0234100-like [Argentina anserina]|uniref:B3 domain-containing protein Os01g0234100-like n=1 Tax=Argentina anserina TaxID=57926 RepID=UPI0021762D81|nr:B3 domain-containing protein Os01g0234100-like [Potentilla anserina]